MDVFGHDDPGEDEEGAFFAMHEESVTQEGGDVWVGEEGEAVLAGEGDEAGAARFDAVHLFAMETASLSLFLLAILSANCKKNENED